MKVALNKISNIERWPDLEDYGGRKSFHFRLLNVCKSSEEIVIKGVYPPSLLTHCLLLTTRFFTFLILASYSLPNGISSKCRQRARIRWLINWIWYFTMASHPHWLSSSFSTWFSLLLWRLFRPGAALIYQEDGFWVVLSIWPFSKLSLGKVVFRFIPFQSKVTYTRIRLETSQTLSGH